MLGLLLLLLPSFHPLSDRLLEQVLMKENNLADRGIHLEVINQDDIGFLPWR